ncbi:MAG: T9SS type A sorting domain-containing protein [Chitinophagaceae bacterium]|nr:T9SS type A sorting domain-containing protein [Chitinophagaceae bacterium]
MKPASMRLLLVALSFSCSATKVFSQCLTVPVSLQEKVSSSDAVITGVVTEKESFIDSSNMQVYTLNKISVKAWLKNQKALPVVYLITEGGTYQNRSTVVYPSLQLQQNAQYVLFLQTAPAKKQSKQLLRKNPAAFQTIPYAGVQGCFVQQMGLFVDAVKKEKIAEADLLSKIKQISKQEAVTPEGKKYSALQTTDVVSRIMSVSSVSPGTTRAGTVVAGDQVTITGNGFGATPGTVYFSNADDGGATFITSGLASDIISWNDNSITVKVPSNAGTGPVNVNGTATSASSLTIQYSHTAIDHNFGGFATATRQRFYLRNLDGLGGYTFQFHNDFAANTGAVAAFNRALITWRCASGVSIRANGTTSVNTSANDGVNAVYFEPSLPSGTLAVCTANYNAGADASCSMQNSVWWMEDVDIQFRSAPATGFNWEFGPLSPSSSEYDFESVALHELGHAHGMGHVIAAGSAMHYALANGAVSRALNSNDLTASTEKLAYSDAATCFNPPGSGTEMQSIAFGSCVSLPITLGELKVKRIGNGQVQLNWNTIQELNNDGFIIERGETPQRFQSIGFVKGREFSLEPKDYNHIDQNAGPYGWYYRLIQKDLDDHRVSSSVVYIKGEESKQWKVWNGEDGNNLSLYNKESQNRKVQFRLFDATGQLVFSSSITNGKAQFSFAHLRRGYYSYQVVDAEQTISGKLVLGQ